MLKKVFEKVTVTLYTAFGLRTLPTNHIDFKPGYEGDLWHRDNACHEGTIWPFLWGEWAMAYLKVNSFSPETCRYIWKQSARPQDHFYNGGCIFTIAEIFDGMEPTRGKGCVQQAWSIGNLLAVFLHPQFNWSLNNQP